MNQSNSTLAKRIADLERRLSNTKNTANTLLEENKQLLIELASVKDLLESSQLCEATAKQYTEEVDKQNQALAAQVEKLKERNRKLDVDLLRALFYAPSSPVSPDKAYEIEVWYGKFKQVHLASKEGES